MHPLHLGSHGLQASYPSSEVKYQYPDCKKQFISVLQMPLSTYGWIAGQVLVQF